MEIYYPRFMSTFIIKRDGRREIFDASKIQRRIEYLAKDLKAINIPELVGITIGGVYNGVTTEMLDNITARAAAERASVESEYDTLAVRLVVSNLHKSTPQTFTESIAEINRQGYLRTDFYEYCMKHAAALNSMIINENDHQYNYLALALLRKTYLFHKKVREIDAARLRQVSKDIAEEIYDAIGKDATPKSQAARKVWRQLPYTEKYIDRPQYALLRMAVACGGGIEHIRVTYHMYSSLQCTHGSSTYLYSGAKGGQMLNCFLLRIGDSTDDITAAEREAAFISKGSGGLGISWDNVRAAGQPINSTGGASAGIIPFIRIFANTAAAWDQGGRRPGSFASYIHVHHADLPKFLLMGDPSAPADVQVRGMFTGLMLTELFYRRWQADENSLFSLFSPDEAPGLTDVYDGMLVCKRCNHCPNPNYAKYFGPPTECEEHFYERVQVYTNLYERYENQLLYTRQMTCKEIVLKICLSIIRSSGPYLLNKDAICRASNQDNCGTVVQSNLCAEIVELTEVGSTACCTLASLPLQNYVYYVDGRPRYDFARLMEATRITVRNLDSIITTNAYPSEESKRNNIDFRPIGLGVQGLGDVFQIFRVPYLSDTAEQLDMLIHEAIYYAALDESCRLAEEYGPYPRFDGSPLSRGMLAMDYVEGDTTSWRVVDGRTLWGDIWRPLDWPAMRNRVMRGVRNVYLRANMPTVNTGDIVGSVCPTTEPINMNIFMKTTSGSMKIAKYNKYLVRHAKEIGIWSTAFANAVATNSGRLPGDVPHEFREIYLTAYEIPNAARIHRAALRGAFIDQTQSFNIFLEQKTPEKLRGLISLGFKHGLKTIAYYVRTIEADKRKLGDDLDKAYDKTIETEEQQVDDVCSRDNPDCASCQG